jgi:hypothetical protein
VIRAIQWLPVACVLLFAPGARAAQSYDSCDYFITSLPAVANAQGTWCLRQDLSTAIASGSAIAVTANNVTLDCNQFKLGGLPAGAGTQAIGIASYRDNVTVRNCHVRGFRIGFSGSSTETGQLIEDNRFQGNTAVGIDVGGERSIVRRNLVLDTGGSATGIAIFAGISSGGGVDVLDNTIDGVEADTSGHDAVGLLVAGPGAGGMVKGNRVRNVVGTDGSQPFAVKVFSHPNSLVGNHLGGAASAVDHGLYCADASSRAQGNVINGFYFSLQGCGDAGGNIVPP